MATWDYQNIINQIYQQALGREPDPSGFQHWLNYAQQQNLSPQQLANMIIQSATPEFDARAEFAPTTSIQDAIIQTYQKVLGRDPEQEGFQHWLHYAQQQGLTPEQISDAIIQAAYPELLNKVSFQQATPPSTPQTTIPINLLDFLTGSQNVITKPEQSALGILSRLGEYRPPGWAMDVFKEIAEHPESEQEKFAYQEAQRFFGPLGQSPYTLEALRAWEELTRPQIEQAMAIQGTYAPSGAFAETLARARTEATVPLLQQDLQSRLSLIPQIASMGATQQERRLGAAGAGSSAGAAAAQMQLAAAQQLSGLGNTLADRFYQSLMNAMRHASMPRTMAQQQIGSQWDEINRLYSTYGQLYFGPFSNVLSQPGITTSTRGGGWGIGK